MREIRASEFMELRKTNGIETAALMNDVDVKIEMEEKEIAKENLSFQNYIDYVFVQSDRFPLKIGQSFRIINTNYPNSLKRKRNQISKAWKSFYFGVTEAGEQMFILVNMRKIDSGCVPKSHYNSSSCHIPVYLECRDKILTLFEKRRP
jgi:hypothetical protein